MLFEKAMYEYRKQPKSLFPKDSGMQLNFKESLEESNTVDQAKQALKEFETSHELPFEFEVQDFLEARGTESFPEVARAKSAPELLTIEGESSHPEQSREFLLKLWELKEFAFKNGWLSQSEFELATSCIS